jgi:S-adenosylmethionine-dependent methyltransferase
MSLVAEFYQDAGKEWQRLDLPLCRIEFATTLHMIEKHVVGHGRVADIGGGPGRYIVGLLSRGYRATLFDLSAQNVAFAEARVSELGLTADAFLVGDARDLSLLDGQEYDAILALGPLDHIIDRQERIAFLMAAKSLLGSNGILIGAHLNAWGICEIPPNGRTGRFADSRNVGSLLTGASFADKRACSGFTECHWSTPDDALAEIQEAGFIILEEAGAEGFASGTRNELDKVARHNPAAFDQIIEFGVLTSTLPQYRRATDHFIVVARA